MPDEKEEYRPEENWGEVEEKTEETEEPEEGSKEEGSGGTLYHREEQDATAETREKTEGELPAKSTR